MYLNRSITKEALLILLHNSENAIHLKGNYIWI